METIKASDEFLLVLLNGERQRGMDLVNELLAENRGVQQIYEEVIKPAMYKVGELWEAGTISVASEHLASAIVESILGQLYYRVITSSGRKGKVAVISSVEQEVHQIGAKMVSDVFELNGWTSHFLGANTPIEELIKFLEKINPNTLGLSVSINLHIYYLEKTIKKVREKFPEIPVLIGGQGLIGDGKEIMLRHHGVLYLKDLRAVESFLKQPLYDKAGTN
ncbi:MAG: cobalamin-dependent protein [Bacteroidales bacterium]